MKTEINQRPGLGTEAESRLPSSELHLQVITKSYSIQLRITN